MCWLCAAPLAAPQTLHDGDRLDPEQYGDTPTLWQVATLVPAYYPFGLLRCPRCRSTVIPARPLPPPR